MKKHPDDKKASATGKTDAAGGTEPTEASAPGSPRPDHIASIRELSEVPTLLSVVSEITGMRYVVVARVTDDSWTAVSVLDNLEFGLAEGGQLDVTTTLCSEVRDRLEPIVIEHASEDAVYCGHPTPKKYGIESYIAVPIVLKNGEFFGTLCAIDSRPADLSGPHILPTFKLFAELISAELSRSEDVRALRASEERYRAFIEHSSEGIWRFELDEPIPVDLPADEQVRLAFERGYLAECNDAMARQYGYSSASDLIGARLGDLMVADDPNNIEFLRAFIAAGYELNDAESHERDAEGKDRYFSNSFVGFLEDGKLVRAWGTQRDVTQSKSADVATARLAAIVTSSDDAIISKDLGGIITSWNGAAEKMFGFTAAEAIGQSINIIIPPDRRDEEADIIRRVFGGESVAHVETFRRRKDGSEINVSLSVSPVLDESGKVIGASKIARDITQQNRAREELNHNQLMLTLAMQSSRMGAWERDVGTNTIWWSEELERIFGLRPGEFPGTDEYYYSLIHEDDREATAAAVRAAIAERRPYVMEFRFRHADGTVRWMEGRGQAVYSQTGEPVRLYGVGIDVTDRKDAESEKRKSDEKYRLLFDSIDQGFCIIEMIFDEDGRPVDYLFLEINNAFLGQTGMENVQGRRMRDIIPEHEQYWFDRYGEVATTGRPMRFEENSAVLGRWFDVYAFPYGGPGSRSVGVLFSDITEKRRAAERLRESDERFRLALSSGAVTVYEQDLDLRYKWVFPDSRYRPDVIGKTDLELSPGREGEQLTELKKQVLRTGEGARQEMSANVLGRTHWFDLLIEPRRDASGALVGVGGTALDITDRKKLQEFLAESEARFRAMMEQAPFSIQLLDVEGYTIRVNRAWEELWGLSIEDLADYNMLEDPQLEAKGVAEHIRKAFAGEPAELPAINYNPNETLPDRSTHERPGRWVSAVAYPLKGSDGKVREVAIIHQDITSRKEAESVMQRYQMLSGNARDVILMMRPDGRIIEVNNAAVAAYGYEREELLGMNLSDLRHPSTHDLLAEQLQTAATGGAHFETIHVKKDGTAFPVEVNSTGADIAGEFILMSIIRDVTERAMAEAVLRESQERFAKAFNASPLVVTITSLRTGKLTEVNQTFVDVTGFSREETIGRSTAELGLWDRNVDRTAELEELQRVGSVRNKEYSFRLKDGTELIGLLSAEVLEIGGEPSALTVIQDVTERKRSEETLRRSEQRLQQMADAMPQIVWVADRDGTVTYYNNRVSEYAGFEHNSDGSWNWSPAVHPEDAAKTVEAWSEAVRKGTVYSIEHRLAMKDGSIRWHLSRAVPIRDADGNILQWYGTATDIHDIRQAQEAVVAAERQAAEEYQRLLTRIVPLAETLGAARDLVTIYRSMGDFVRASMPCSAFFVSFFDPATRLRTAAYVWGEDGELDVSLLPPIELTRDGGPNSQAVYEKRSVIVNSYMDWMSGRPHIVFNENGVDPMSSIAVPMIVMDRVTGTLEVQAYENYAFSDEHVVALEMAANLAAVAIENVRLIEIEAEARAAAESANLAKDEFLSVLSHELRTPLNAMLGWVRMLRSDVLDKESAAKALEVIERNTRLQGSLIEDLLDVSRIISGKMRIETEAVDLLTVIRTVSETVRPLAASKEITYVTEAADDNIFLHADPVRLQQVVSNLVQNAIKFTPAGGKVSVAATRAGGEAVLTVTDSGIGIDAEFLPYIFDRFRQADASTKRNYTGLGLGLTITKTIVALHGGDIEVESGGPDKGSVFRVRLPLADEFYSRSAEAEEILTTGGSSLSGVRILLVDDDAESLGPIKLFLEGEDAAIETAGSAAEALEKFLSGGFDVLISDIGMPQTDGYELIRSIRSTENGGPSIKAIALTAYASEDDREKVFAAGFQSHLAKPVNFDELLRTLASLL